MRSVRLKNRDQTYEVELEVAGSRVRFRLDRGQESQAEVGAEPPWLRLSTAQGRYLLAVQGVGQRVWVWVGGRAEAFDLQVAGARAPQRVQQNREVLAPLTGKVAAVRVKPGDSVQEGDILVTLEAMKMEYHLRAPFPAQVEAVACRQGELVDLGQVLVRLTPPGTA
ncbi:MAG: biotin/lipoyl-binding protein [Chloroflexi bacterium]|nr:biotin/lipoyl-binding protein [Chloroflexota bacterium]